MEITRHGLHWVKHFSVTKSQVTATQGYGDTARHMKHNYLNGYLMYLHALKEAVQMHLG